MKNIQILTIFTLLLFSFFSYSQNGVLTGRVYNDINNESIPFASITLESTQIGTTSDMDGNYTIDNLNPGSYTIICSYLGFRNAVFYEIIISSTKPTILNIPLVEEASMLANVELKTSSFNNRSQESPVSKRTISATEIYRNPGGNRDISKVIQVLPGVASTVSFRNDIIVRGGAPNENKFFLDGIEVPNINHFATQGSSGGPVGMINVNFIQNVDFYAGAFPANRGNGMSSIMEFKQIEGNKEKLRGTFMIGSSDIGLTLDGPTGKNSSFILSARRSYLQFLFEALNLPFLPTYNDFQYKHSININDKNQLTIVGLGAIDNFELNKSVNDGITDPEEKAKNEYYLNNLPVNEQWNYTIGANWKHFSEHSFQTVVLSRSHLNNSAIKYQNNIEQPENLLLNYNSEEIENKLRIESTKRKEGWKWNIGAGFENVIYSNATFNRKQIDGVPTIIDFNSKLTVNKYAVFTQLSHSFFENRLSLSGGLRTDFNNYSPEMSNPFDQFSPRFSASYRLTDEFSASFNLGRYYQLPAYTVMGYRDSDNILVNKENEITYIQNDQFVAGLEYNPNNYAKITLEGFYKIYDNYPFLLDENISLANLGGDFGVIGNEPANSTSQGKSYGLELLMQQRMSSSIYGIISYTFVRSEFKDQFGVYVPSSWDNRHILNITAGKKFKRDWEFGAKFRLLGGAPYTPYDVALSSQKDVWDITQQGVNDWSKLNTERNGISHGLDIRIDKKWFFQKWALNAYIDIQNVYNAKTQVQPFLDVRRDGSGNPIQDPNNPNAYLTYEIENDGGTILPSIGIMIEF